MDERKIINTARESISVEVHNLTVTYDKLPVLWEIDFHLPTQQIIGIVGQNGSGKTTLIKAIMGLMEGASGNVKIFGKQLKDVRERIAYVPQRSSVDWDFPISVSEVVEMGRFRRANLFRRLTLIDKELIKNALEKVNMTAFADRQIAQLSGGQQQRVFIARALAQNADLIVLDEPFVGVDAATEEAILKLLQQLRDEGKTIVMVHHDLNTVSTYFDYLVMLNTRQIASGPINEVLTEENIKAAFGGQLNVLMKLQTILKNERLPIREEGFEDKTN
jgi:manganese/zinc/iron transport system ATP- binding protein